MCNIHVLYCLLSVLEYVLIFRQYFTIASNDQRLQYKQDFNTEYEEYRQLHAKIDKVSQKFLQLQILRKQTPRDSLEFEVGLSRHMLPLLRQLCVAKIPLLRR